MILLTKYIDSSDWIESRVYIYSNVIDAFNHILDDINQDSWIKKIMENNSILPFKEWNEIDLHIEWEWDDKLDINYDPEEWVLLSFKYTDGSDFYLRYLICECSPNYFYNMHY